MNSQTYFDKLFYPKSIAIIEASSRIPWYIKGIIEWNYKGDLYLISKKEEEVLGIRCYKDISEIPDGIDLGIIAVNRKKLIDIINKCIAKKFYNLHIFSAGLGEYDEYGLSIERELYELLKNSKTRAIGPNCMGIYSPEGRFSYSPYFSKSICNANCVSFVSHSGDLTTRYVIKLNQHGVFFSNVASIGNSIDLRFSDFLNYFINNSKTDIIMGYFEGFSQFGPPEGKKLLEILKNNKKPLLLLRGGVTGQGKRSVKSHTGTIASDSNVWNSIFKQSNALKMETYEELIDTTIAFYFCKNLYPKVKSILLITWSGGKAVLGVDRIVNLGIDVPEIQEPVKSKLKSMISIGSIANPLDLPWIGRHDKFPEICKIALNEPYIGGVIFETFAPLQFDDRFKIYYANILKIANYCKKVKKPFLLSLPYTNIVQREQLKKDFIKDRIPIFPSIERAARAFLNLFIYQIKIITNSI
ncbi:MAG: CoA-binding protein [Candidatus Helarchaeota archaeon]